MSTHLTEDQLEDYFRGNVLTEATRDRVVEHLLVCPACARRAEREEAFQLTVRDALRFAAANMDEDPGESAPRDLSIRSK